MLIVGHVRRDHLLPRIDWRAQNAGLRVRKASIPIITASSLHSHNVCLTASNGVRPSSGLPGCLQTLSSRQNHRHVPLNAAGSEMQHCYLGCVGSTVLALERIRNRATFRCSLLHAKNSGFFATGPSSRAAPAVINSHWLEVLPYSS